MASDIHVIFHDYTNQIYHSNLINIVQLNNFKHCISILGSIKPLPKKATRNVTMAALLIEEVTRNLANE